MIKQPLVSDTVVTVSGKSLIKLMVCIETMYLSFEESPTFHGNTTLNI